MRTFTSVAALVLVAGHSAFAQPMSGSYNVGGASPSFLTL